MNFLHTNLSLNHEYNAYQKATLTDYEVVAERRQQLGYSNDAEELNAHLYILLSLQEYQLLVGEINDQIVGWIQLQRTITIREALHWPKKLGYLRLRV